MCDNVSYLEKKTRELFDMTKSNLSQVDIDEITDYITHGECGVAYDHICVQLYEYNIPISKKTYTLIDEIGKYLEYKESEWVYLQKLITSP